MLLTQSKTSQKSFVEGKPTRHIQQTREPLMSSIKSRRSRGVPYRESYQSYSKERRYPKVFYSLLQKDLRNPPLIVQQMKYDLLADFCKGLIYKPPKICSYAKKKISNHRSPPKVFLLLLLMKEYLFLKLCTRKTFYMSATEQIPPTGILQIENLLKFFYKMSIYKIPSKGLEQIMLFHRCKISKITFLKTFSFFFIQKTSKIFP